MNKEYPKCLIFLGPPASGKSKFQKIMIERYNLPPVGLQENIELNFEPYENTIKINPDKYSYLGSKNIYIPDNFEINKLDVSVKDELKLNKEILKKHLLNYFKGDSNHTYLWGIDDLIYKCKSRSSSISINNYVINKLVQTSNQNGTLINLEKEEKNFKNLLKQTCQIYIYYICLLIEKTIENHDFTYVNTNQNSGFTTRKNYVSRLMQSDDSLFTKLLRYCKIFENSNPEIDNVSDAIEVLNYLDNIIFACNTQENTQEKSPENSNKEQETINDNIKIKNYVKKVIHTIKKIILNDDSIKDEYLTVDKLLEQIIAEQTKNEGPIESLNSISISTLRKFINHVILEEKITKIKKHIVYKLYYTSYWITRKEKIISFADSFISFDDVQENILDTLVKNKINFIWESVGDNLNNSWFYNQVKELYEHNYRIYSMIPMVETETLKLRMLDRTKESINMNKPRVFFDISNINNDTLENKIKKIYDSFKIIANMISESSIFDNRLIKPNIQQFNKYNERADKIYFRKNILSCEEGMCLIINPETSIYYPPKKNLLNLQSKEEDFENIHVQYINTLPYKDAYDDVSNIATSADIVKVHFNKLLMKINETTDTINKFKLNINTVYNFVNNKSFRKQWYTEKKNFVFEDKTHIPDIFEMTKKCNIEFSEIRHRIENNVCKSIIPTIYELLKDNIGSNIDYLNVYADIDSYDLITNLVGGNTAEIINKKIEKIKTSTWNISKTYLRINDDKLFIESLLGSLLLLELINRKIINSSEFNKYKNHQTILFRIGENQVRLPPESEWAYDNRNKLILKKLDNHNRFSSTSPFIITKNFINYGINDWTEQINQSHVAKFNQYYNLTGEAQKQYTPPQKLTDTCLISVYFIPYKSRLGIKKQIYNINNINDPERFGQSNETCILPNHELIPIKIYPNKDENSSKEFTVKIEGLLPEEDTPSLELKMKANMALYDFKDNEKDFMNNLVFIPDYLSWLINKISPTALSSTDSIVNFIFNSVFHSGFIGVKENEVLVGPYQINKSIPLNKNYIERNTVKIKKELLKLLENELNQTDSYHQKYLKYKNKYLQLKKQIYSI